MVAANPETGEVHRVGRGRAAALRRPAPGITPTHTAASRCEVLELFAPPPSTGTSGAYARTRPYLERSLYADDDALGGAPGGRPAG